MSRLMFVALLGASCTSPSVDTAPTDAAPPPGSLTLTVSPLVPGAPATFTVTGAAAGRRVNFVRSNAVQANGFCPAPIAPNCLDLRSPATVQFGVNANGAGRASTTVTLPNPLPLASVTWQAATFAGGAFDSSNTLVTPIYQPASDTDGDGLTAIDEVTLHQTHPGVADTDGGGLDDGAEVAQGGDPTDPSDDVVVVIGVDSLLPGEIVITEIMKDPGGVVADGDGEWFEILNVAGFDIDLQNMLISDDGTNNHRVNASVIVPAGGRAVLGINANTALNGGVQLDYSYQGAAFFLDNTDDEVVLENAFGELARVNYDDGVTFPDVTGATLSLDPAFSTEADNDLGANWCDTPTAVYGGQLQRGTPGAVNEACPPPPPTWNGNVRAVIQANCSCHLNGGAAGGRSWDDYADMFQQSLAVPALQEVEPGDPAASYLLHKINGTQATVGGTGVQMPRGRPPLSAPDRAMIEAWIAGGAPEN